MMKRINLAGEETTARIGVHKIEELLNEVSAIALKSLYLPWQSF